MPDAVVWFNPACSKCRTAVGTGPLHCPNCHGWEVRDQPLGVLGSNAGSILHAQLPRQWSDDVVYFA